MVKLNGKAMWTKFKYLKLPDFCYGCGVLGHTLKTCEVTDPDTLACELQYGAWLRASPMKPDVAMLKWRLPKNEGCLLPSGTNTWAPHYISSYPLMWVQQTGGTGRDQSAIMLIDERTDVIPFREVFKRKLGNWSLLFPEAQVQHLDLDISDHLPILLRCHLRSRDRNHRGKRFQFENMWATNPGIQDVIADAWKSTSGPDSVDSLLLKIDKCVSSLMQWNDEHFGNVRREIRRLEGQLPREYELGKRKDILGKIREWWKREEILWWQRAKSDYLKYGDSNTCWFHSCATMRRARNHIEALTEEDGGVNEDRRRDIRLILDIREVLSYNKYLSLPTIVGRSKRRPFLFIWDRIWKRLTGDVIVAGTRWLIDNGSSMDIWGSRWLPRPRSFGVITAKPKAPQIMKACDLIDYKRTSWGEELIRETFVPYDTEQILSIPLCDQ
ncbi:hypothetical protein Cgig2_019105 [Carnegiea gigantea]|uniref:Zinc knuckle CX2CX4HX4C domain-containing protein n=1 Tax=Carnegiea gigantea TaxID=171969 RepID=A0A9Q1QGL4_9CARY|nr:hypothetical protein Cgig2_019105 [Carnegiea gigantea]